MVLECLFCEIGMIQKALNMHNLTEEKKKQVTKELLSYLSTINDDLIAPLVARDIHKKINVFTSNPDPYKKIKNESNDLLFSRINEWRKIIQQSENQFETALRLAIAGNIIDYGPAQQFNIESTIQKVLNSDFAIDHSKQLEESIKRSKKLLYLADNTGEIVMDRLFLEQIQHPNVYFAVRSEAILNDALKEDALFVGIDKLATIIENGSNAPTTVLSEVSDEFKQVYNQADLIISKGQGNFEGLLNVKEKNIFFLLMIKCDQIASIIGVKKGDFVVYKRN